VPSRLTALMRDLIHERTGLLYDGGKDDVMVERLTPLALDRGFSSLLDYYYLLKYDADGAAEWRRVADALSVGETYFWRGMDQVSAFVDHLVPRLLAARPRETIRVWSAACSTGEEPLTIAMALAEAGLHDAPVEIFASDASPAAVERARRGLYRERAFRALPPAMREKYFVAEGDAWRVAPDLHARVRWATVNLRDEGAVAPFATARAIFCRNVFIYFSESAIRKTVRSFFERMPAPGYLFVAASESLLRVTADFEFEQIGDAFVYVKPPPDGDRSDEATTL
jgi:chemotaxis protein methyltransferase CheR